jgi:alkanesulfonate monooxygenase SsuD/methylene tetrahydromethanopterin reductase-like flavin-dependent oxidoreductase (luciferase family)
MSISVGFGLITCQRYPGDPRSAAQIYDQALQLAEEAEACGLDSVWVSEHFAHEVAPLVRKTARSCGA